MVSINKVNFITIVSLPDLKFFSHTEKQNFVLGKPQKNLYFSAQSTEGRGRLGVVHKGKKTFLNFFCFFNL